MKGNLFGNLSIHFCFASLHKNTPSRRRRLWRAQRGERIKKFNLIYVVLIAFPLLIYADASVNLFAQAQKLYQQHEYAAALDAYKSMKEKDAATWFNMGNCSYALADYPAARIYWRRAERLATSWQLLTRSANNLRLLEQEGKELTPESWAVSLARLMKMIPLLPLQILFLVLWFLLFGALLGVGRVRKIWVPLSAVVVVVAMMVTIRYTSTTQSLGVVTGTEAVLFAGPDDHYHVLATLSPAHELEITLAGDQWCKVAGEQGGGWVKREAITIV